MPPAGTVHLWFLDLRKLGNPMGVDLDPAKTVLNTRQRRSLRRFYLRLLLGAYLGIPGKDVKISRQVRGKPVLVGPGADRGVDFSQSNSDDCCLIGVCSAGLLGVDMERKGRRVGDPAALSLRYFSEAEAEMIAAQENRVDEAFLHTWALKEAVVKAAGHGIADQLHRFTVTCMPGRPPRMLTMQDDDPSGWRLAVLQPSPTHVAAVALRHPLLVIEGYRLAP